MKFVSKLMSVLCCAALCCAVILPAAGCSDAPHTHELARVASVAATCTEEGNITYYYCEGCDSYFADGNANTQIERSDTVLEALGHKTVRHDAAEEGSVVSNNGTEYWQCERCGATFAEEGALTAVTVSKPMFVDQTFYSTSTENGPDMFASTDAGGDYPAIEGQFVLRFFMGFNYDLTEVLDRQSAEVHMNIHRSGSDPDWWQLLFIYNPVSGKTVVRYGNVTHTEIRLTDPMCALVEEQNGLYFLLVRDGASATLYAEDASGTPQKLADIADFDAGNVYRMRIAHLEGYFANKVCGGVIRDMEIALGTTDLDAERSNPVNAG